MAIKTRLLLLILTVAPTMALAADDEKALVGVWRYASEVDTRADGSPAPSSVLSTTQGLLIYTADGYMSVVHMPVGRSWLAESATAEQMRETIDNGNAYAGRYEVDSAAHTITHITSVSLEPEFQGKRLTRKYSVNANTLRLSGTFPNRGELISFVITWTRASPAASESEPPNNRIERTREP